MPVPGTAKFWLLLTLAALAQRANADCVPAPSGLVSWWPADGSAADIASTNSGVLEGGAIATAPGMDGSAFGFDGTNGYVQVPDSLSLRPANLTIECWVKFASLNSAGSGGSPAGAQYIVFKQNSSSGSFEGFDLSKTRSGSSDYFTFIVSSASGQSASARSTTAISTGVWYHIAGVRASSSIQLYVNGALERQQNVSFPQDYGNYPLYFGTSGQPSYEHKLSGSLDEVSLYNRALSATEISAIYAAGSAGKCKAPNITVQPQSQSIVAGSNATLSVSATGLGVLTYQWQFNGVPIPSASTTTFTLPNVQVTNAGTYSVLVTNALGSALSAPAILTVLLPPFILGQPTNQAVPAGQSATFSVQAGGTAPLSYQWLFNGVPLTDGSTLSGSSSPTLSIPRTRAANAGSYQVLVTNALGAATSSVAQLTLSAPVSSVIAWGYDSDGQTNVPAGLTDVVAVAAGDYHSLALRRNGTVVAWGRNWDGECNVPPGLSNVVAITGGNYFSAAVQADGTIVEWGYLPVLGPPGLDQPLALEGSGALILALGPEAIPVAWGYPYYGQLNIPPAATNVLAIAAGQANHNLALRADRNIVGWGDDTYGQCDVPPGLTNVAAIAVGWGYSVALRADSTVAAWGWNDYGQVNVPVGLSNVVAIASGYEHTVGIMQDGTVRAWGRDRIGQTEVPAGLSNVVALSAGTFHTLALSRVGPPEIVQQPWNETVARDGTIEPACNAVGDHLQYAWQFNGAPLPGATLANLLLTNVQPAQAGLYSVAVSNDLGMVESSNALVSVIPLAITAQPTNQALYEALDTGFSVGVQGTGPFAYQWLFNGSALAGQTNQALFLPSVDATQAGTYSVLVTNAYGSTQSTDAVLTVFLPNITAQPTNQTVVGGQQVTFVLAATGAALTYQWLLNSLDLPGQTNTSLTLSNVAPDEAGPYSAFVTDGHRTLVSSNALLTVIPFLFTLQPSNTVVIATSNVTFSAAVSGTTPLFYQWQKDGQNLTDGPSISGSQGGTLMITGAQTTDAGNYQLVVTNAYSAMTSQVATLTVLVSPSFVLSPTNQAWIAGSSGTLFSLAAGTAPLSYQWYLGTTSLTDGARLSGTASPTLSISNVLSTDAGSYTVVATNAAGSATSTVAVVTVVTPPSFTTQPTGWSVPVGFPLTLSGRVSGTAPLSYQWLFNGTNLAGATSTTLSFAALSRSNYGNYQLVATNLGGAVTSTVAPVTVGQVAFWGTYSQVASFSGWPAPGLSNVVALAAGSGFSLALRGDGTLYGWGGSSVANIPAGLSGIVGIAAGYSHALAIRSNGTVFAWGSNTSGQTNVPPGLSNVVAVAGGIYHSAALRADGTVVAWGGTVRTGETNVPAGLIKVTAIDADGNQTLALRQDGTVVGWGGTAPVPVPPYLQGVTAVSSAGTTPDFSLALLTNGTLTAWNSAGLATNLPPGLTDLVAVENTVGSGGVEPNATGVCLALRSNGTVVAWGGNIVGALSLTNLPTALSNVVAMAAGATHAVALENDGSPVIIRPPVGGTFCSGADLVLRATAVGAPPLSCQWFNNSNPVPGATNQTLLVPAAQASDAGNYQLVVTNVFGVSQSLAVPVAIVDSAPVFLSQPASAFAYFGSPWSVGASVIGSGPLQLTWLQNGLPIAAGTNQLCFDRALPQHGGAYQLIASNSFGAVTSAVAQIAFSRIAAWGIGPSLTNAPFDPGSVLGVASGYYHALAIQSNGTVTAWGTTLNGATNVPPGLSNVVAVAGGSYFSTALKSDGTVVSWGAGSSGQTNVPAGLSNVVAISVGQGHTLALQAGGMVASWGYNTYGQVPVPAGLSNVVAVAAGSFQSLALKDDGTIVTWGLNGQLPTYTNVVAISAGYNQCLLLQADGTVLGWAPNGAAQPLPPGLTNVVAISAGGGWQGFPFSLALRADGTLVAWGNNANGQLLIPADLLSATTISAGGGSSLAFLNDRSPAFTVQPWNRTVASGTNVTLCALAVGQTSIRYQWYWNGQALPGATSNFLAFPSTLPAQSGAYQLVAMNDFGAVTSAVATLTVTVPPVRLSAVGAAANGFRFSFTSLPAVLYIAEFKDTLSLATWTELERRFGVGGLEVVTDPSALGAARFYRVRALYAPPPRVTSTAWNGSALSFSFTTVPDAIYVIQYKDHLNDPAWQEFSRQTGTGAPIVISDPSPAAPSRFYRLQVE
jgi:alpha-tubulin suppressor-like RCC1 family protein